MKTKTFFKNAVAAKSKLFSDINAKAYQEWEAKLQVGDIVSINRDGVNASAPIKRIKEKKFVFLRRDVFKGYIGKKRVKIPKFSSPAWTIDNCISPSNESKAISKDNHAA